MTSPNSVTVQLIGEVSVRRGDRVVDPRAVGGPRCADALAYLTVHRHRDVSMDELASIIWPRARPQSWNATVRNVISKVRDTLETVDIPGDSIRSRRGYVRFLPPDSVTVDLEAIRDQCRKPQESAHIRADRAQLAHRRLADAPLRGVTGDWADELRAECDGLRIEALTVDASSSLETGDFDRSVTCAETLIGLDPLRERAYRLAMHGYLGLGDRAQALDVATRCRRTLSDELGIDPSPETERLFLNALRDDTDAPGPHRGRKPKRRLPSAFGALPAVARESELDTIIAAWDKAAAGVGQSVIVTGDAGMGKTTLVLEAIERARELGFDVLYGRCSEDAIIAFEPFVEAAEREIDTMDQAHARQWLIENGPEILRLLPHAARRFSDLVPAAGGDDRALIVTAVHQWLTATTRSRPTLLVVDDLHWATDATHALLRYLVHASSAHPVCFIVTARTQALTEPHLNSTLNTATRLGGVHRITLSEFSIADVRHLVSVHDSPLDAEELHRRTNGHPLFVSSLLAEGRDNGATTYPASIVEFVRRAGHDLSATARRLLQVCSVVGVSVSRSVLHQATHDVDDIAFANALDELLRTRMVVLASDPPQMAPWSETTSRLPAPTGDDDIALRHPLVQEVVYADIPPGARAALHSQVGHALEELGTRTAAEDAALVAHHLGRGLSADQRRAGVYAHLAADYALALGAYEDALSHYSHALDHTPPGDGTEAHCRLLIGLGRARRAIRDPGARAPALAAVAMARRLGDRALQVEAVLASERRGMEFVQQYAVDTERVDMIDAICADMVREGQDSTPEFATLLSQVTIERAWDTGHHDRGRLITRAADIARALGDGPLLARVGVAALIGLRIPHSRTVAESALEDLNNLVGTAPGALRDVTTIVWISRARLGSGDLVGAEAALAAITDAHIDGDPELDWLVKYGRLGVDLAAGRLVRAQERLVRIRAIPPSPTDSGHYGRLLPALTALGTLRGDLQEIVGQSDFMRGYFHINAVLRPALAVALLDVGDREGAAELLSWYTPARLADIPVDPMWLSTLTLIARAAAELSAAALCEQVYGHLSAHADCTVLTWASVYGVVHHHLAHLALGFGDLTRASYHIADAQDIHASRGFIGWTAESNYLALRIDAATRGSVDDSRMAEVREQALGIGATAVVRRIDALATETRG